MTLEEKREKLALLLIDLHHKLRSVNDQAVMPDGHYNGDIFSFDTIDRVVVEAFAILKEDVNSIGALDTLKRRLMTLNAEKQKMLNILSMSYSPEHKNGTINDYRQLAQKTLPGVTFSVEQIERSLKEKFGIVNPYTV